MDQAKELLELVKLLRLINSDILVFSGYTHQELLKNTTQREILNEIAVLVDGPYIESLNNALPLRGSSNQNILLFDLTHESRYADYLNTEKKRIQNFYFDDQTVADGLFCREIDGLFCRSSPDIIVRRRCVLSHKRRGWLQPSPSFRYSRNLALQDELYHPVINNGPAVLVCVDKRLGTGPVNQSRDAG